MIITWLQLATSTVVACSPTNFLDLLSRITNPELREHAVRKGIFEIFDSSR